jgi:capsular exopolysaccharide synthesis family protein
VLVCSAGPGEGKTLVASNLAAALAGREQRVLLVDVDLHRPRVHSVFSIEQSPGITDVLAGKSKLVAAVRPSGLRNLWLLTAGQTPERASAFLGGGPHFRDLLDSVASQFDWVIFDSPPVLAVADSTLIAQDVTGVLLVVSTEKTTRDAARVAVERLDAAGARFFGAVLNRANVERHEYYFDPYYRREYETYYGSHATPRGKRIRPETVSAPPVIVAQAERIEPPAVIARAERGDPSARTSGNGGRRVPTMQRRSQSGGRA